MGSGFPGAWMGRAEQFHNLCLNGTVSDMPQGAGGFSVKKSVSGSEKRLERRDKRRVIEVFQRCDGFGLDSGIRVFQALHQNGERFGVAEAAEDFNGNRFDVFLRPGCTIEQGRNDLFSADSAEGVQGLELGSEITLFQSFEDFGKAADAFEALQSFRCRNPHLFAGVAQQRSKRLSSILR